MDKRKEQILNIIIKEYIKTGIPVGSSALVSKYKMDISPATVRNEMALLEDEGYIAQPHTSAGRIPTEKAYNFYIQNLKIKKISNDFFLKFNDILVDSKEESFKKMARALSEITNSAIFWAFHRHNLYYTGVSNLFKQPEFMPGVSKLPVEKNFDILYDISAIIDRMEDIIDEIFEKVEFGENIYLGSKNPFGNFCGTIMYKYKSEEKIGIFGLLGPMRIDYEKNISLMRQIFEKINQN